MTYSAKQRRRFKAVARAPAPTPKDHRDHVVSMFQAGAISHAEALDALLASNVDRQVALDALAGEP